MMTQGGQCHLKSINYLGLPREGECQATGDQIGKEAEGGMRGKPRIKPYWGFRMIGNAGQSEQLGAGKFEHL